MAVVEADGPVCSVSRKAKAVGLLIAALPALLLAQAYNETEVKSAFVFQFTHYVEYPASAFGSPTAPFVIGVLGRSAIIDALREAVRGKNVHGRSIVERQVSRGQELRQCHVLFIPEEQARNLPKVLEELEGAPVLTVGESAGFSSRGGTIGFFTEQNRLRFEINVDSARRAHLTISSKLLSLARIVKGGQKE